MPGETHCCAPFLPFGGSYQRQAAIDDAGKSGVENSGIGGRRDSHGRV
jgi:hypothetical protein